MTNYEEYKKWHDVIMADVKEGNRTTEDAVLDFSTMVSSIASYVQSIKATEKDIQKTMNMLKDSITELRDSTNEKLGDSIIAHINALENLMKSAY